MTTSQPPVLSAFERETGVARITFNRPQVLNALDVPTAAAFRDAVDRIVGTEGVRCIVLAGAGRAFVAGGDVASFTPDPPRIVSALLDALHPAILALRACRAPVLAIVQGAAAGAGLSLVLGADLVIASETSRFVIAYDRLGASPDCGCTWFLPRRVGRGRAFELMLLGKTLGAAEAREIGIVTEVVPAAELEAWADALARRIASGPTGAYGSCKRLVDDAIGPPLDRHLEAERAHFLRATATADFKSGVEAFAAKRAPVFSGR